MAQGVGAFTAADVALLDEIAETILPETSTPGAKAAKTGAFMALMVTDVYTDRNQQVFRDGMRALEDACRATTSASASCRPRRPSGLPCSRYSTASRRRRWRSASHAPRTRYPAAAPPPDDEPPHYFRMMKELALLGYFTSEIGYTKAMRYRESPGRFDPDVPASGLAIGPGRQATADAGRK